MKLTISDAQLNTLIRAVEIQFDIESDVVTEELYPSNDATAITVAELAEMRQTTAMRIHQLLHTQEMLLTLRQLQAGS